MDKRHYLHSRGGRLGSGTDTTLEALDALVDALCADGRRHLVLHFHGGLVSKSSGLGIAERLMDVYSPAADRGGYPVFFVWESGAWEAIRNNITELADEPVFKHLLRKLVQYAFEKVAGRGGAEAAEKARKAFETFWEAPKADAIPFAGFVPPATEVKARSAAWGFNEDEVLADLQEDESFRKAMATLPGLPPATRSAFSPGAEEHRSPFSLKAAEVFSAESRTRGLVELYQVAKFLVKVLKAILKRYAAGRDHGLYATCVEEAIRAFKIAGSGINQWGQALEWNRMKQDTEDAFGPDPNLHVGTALLHRLKKAMAEGRLALDRITLVGHSTGAIYIAHWLEHSGAYLPQDLRQDVVYLAPAITYDDFAQTLSACGGRMGNFRMFAMNDALEREDQVWGSDEALKDQQDWRRFIYPSSLLYLVSGILETKPDGEGGQVDAPDMPLLGMQRFYADQATYPDATFPAIREVRAWVQGKPKAFVWSKSTGHCPGMDCESIDHGAFDEDAATKTSLTHIVSVGF